MRAAEQLALSIFRGPRFAEADFLAAPSNADALAWLTRTAEWPDRRLALWGEPGCGKTHLLHIWAARTGAALLSGAGMSRPDGVARPGIALDDADTCTDERALLHLLNTAGESGLPVLLAARAPPARWTMHLPDLASRLRAMTAVEIGPPEDELLRALLARLLADRQLRPPQPVQEWLVRRLPRSAAALRDAVDRLDAASLNQHRNITQPFAALVLADMLAPDEASRTGCSPEGKALL